MVIDRYFAQVGNVRNDSNYGLLGNENVLCAGSEMTEGI